MNTYPWDLKNDVTHCSSQRREEAPKSWLITPKNHPPSVHANQRMRISNTSQPLTDGSLAHTLAGSIEYLTKLGMLKKKAETVRFLE